MEAIATVRARAKAIVAPLRTAPKEIAAQGLSLALRGEEQLAFELFRAAPKAALSLTPAQIERMLPVLHDWNSTDCFACFVSGVAWRNGVLQDSHILAWAKSTNLWARRAALASTIPLNCKARGATSPVGEARKTLAVCTLLVDDREDMVVKAMSWAVRELSTKDPEAAAAFVHRYADRLAPRVLRETKNKMTTGLKNPKKLAKSKPSPTPRTKARGTRTRQP